MKSYTDLEQSKKLAKILSHESADMVYVHTIDLEGDEHYDIDFRNNQPLFEDDICAWSLAALLNVLPKTINFGYENDSTFVLKPLENGKYLADYYEVSFVKDNPIDACYEMILKLHELKML